MTVTMSVADYDRLAAFLDRKVLLNSDGWYWIGYDLQAPHLRKPGEPSRCVK